MNKKIYIVLPTLKINGGNHEAFQLGEKLKELGHSVNFIIMWKSLHETERAFNSKTYLTQWKNKFSVALLQLPIIIIRFLRFISVHLSFDKNETIWIFTHFSTYPLALFIEKKQRWFFVQGLEWLFIKNLFISRALYYFIIQIYRGSSILTTNSYLTSMLEKNKIKNTLEIPIWAHEQFLATLLPKQERLIDFVMVLRRGHLKRLDLYVNFIQINQKKLTSWKICVITPEDEIAELAKQLDCEYHLRPSIEEMKKIYSRSRYFLHFSDHEGFGLPPLEAMGSGCVPICRDSGGIRAYMVEKLEKNILPLDWDINLIFTFLEKAIMDFDNWSVQSQFAKEKFIHGQTLKMNRLKTLSILFK